MTGFLVRLSSFTKQFSHYLTRRARIVKKQNIVVVTVLLVIAFLSVIGRDSIRALYEIEPAQFSSDFSENSSGVGGTAAESGEKYQLEKEEDILKEPSADQKIVSYAVSNEVIEIYKEIVDTLKNTALEGKFDVTKSEDCKLADIDISNVSKFDRLTESELLKCFPVSEELVTKLKEHHSSFKSFVKDTIMPKFKKLEESKDKLYQDQGVVIVAGGKYSLMAMPVIKSIRENGGVTIKNTLPIELIIPPSESDDKKFCTNVLPKLDPTGLTNCVFLSDYFDSETLKHVAGYQLKAFSLLVSSFEKVLLLDADNYVINSLDNFFDGDIFRETGMILWPDFWRRVHNPRLYDIAGLKVERKQVRYSVDYISPKELYTQSDKSKVPFHDFEGAIPDGSTESGQMLVDKSKHLDTIIMSLYYNFNGPSYYYRLLGQALAGEGDKDTFIFASHVMNHRYYQVRSPVSVQGYWGLPENEVRIPDQDLQNYQGDKKKFRGLAMIQHDYNDDKRYDSWAREILGNTFKEKMKEYRENWILEHKADFKDLNSKDAMTKVSKDQSVTDKFWDGLRDKYKFSDFLQFFKFSTPLFVHSNLPKYDPWELSASGDLTYNGKKATKHLKDKTGYKSISDGHYRMYSTSFQDSINYDLELANWQVFESCLCSSPEDYLNFSYLDKVINEKENPTQQVRKMCEYIKDRVTYLKSTTWDGSRY